MHFGSKMFSPIDSSLHRERKSTEAMQNLGSTEKYGERRQQLFLTILHLLSVTEV